MKTIFDNMMRVLTLPKQDGGSGLGLEEASRIADNAVKRMKVEPEDWPVAASSRIVFASQPKPPTKKARAISRADRRRAAIAKIYSAAIQKVLSNAEAETLANVRKNFGPGVVAASEPVRAADPVAASIVFRLPSFAENFFIAMQDAADDALDMAGEGTMADFGMPGLWKTPDGLASEFVIKRANKLKDVPQGIYDDIVRRLEAGSVEGESEEHLADRIRDVFDQTYRGRAEVVARTEASSTYGTAALESIKQAGGKTKTWLSCHDADVRDAHADLDGTTIPVDEQFHAEMVTPKGVLLTDDVDGPGDPDGEAWNVISCRCTLVIGDSDDLFELETEPELTDEELAKLNACGVVGDSVKAGGAGSGSWEGPGDPRFAWTGAAGSGNHQTDNPAFKAWFGDSKVVDKDGKPLVKNPNAQVNYPEFTGHPEDPNYRDSSGWGLKIGASERMEQMRELDGKKGGFLSDSPPCELLASQGKMDEAVESFKTSWSDSASGPMAAMAQQIVSEKYGGAVWSQGLPVMQISDPMRSVVEAIQKDTQKSISELPAEITIYRGLRSQTASRNALESWSVDKELAARFDGAGLLKATIPRGAVFMDLRKNSEMEKELVVFGGKVGKTEYLPPIKSRFGSTGYNPLEKI